MSHVLALPPREFPVDSLSQSGEERLLEMASAAASVLKNFGGARPVATAQTLILPHFQTFSILMKSKKGECRNLGCPIIAPAPLSPNPFLRLKSWNKSKLRKERSPRVKLARAANYSPHHSISSAVMRGPFRPMLPVKSELLRFFCAKVILNFGFEEEFEDAWDAGPFAWRGGVGVWRQLSTRASITGYSSQLGTPKMLVSRGKFLKTFYLKRSLTA